MKTNNMKTNNNSKRKLKNIRPENKGGDCFKVHSKIAMGDFPRGIGGLKFIGTPYVVHAQVVGQGVISGLKYGHAWIEDDVFVYDFSNGRENYFLKKSFYLLGGIIETKPFYYKYTFKEACDKMWETDVYGPWDLKTESGL